MITDKTKKLDDYLSKISDILYFEGPILSLYSDNNGNLVLARWVDCSESSNFWILSTIDPETLLSLLKKMSSLLKYYQECTEYLKVEINSDFEIINKTFLVELKKSDLPASISFLSETMIEDNSKVIQNLLDQKLIKTFSNKTISQIFDNNSSENEKLESTEKKKLRNASKKLREYYLLFKSLQTEQSQRIIELLLSNDNLDINEISDMLSIDISPLSLRIGTLRRSGIILASRKNKNIMYKLNKEKLFSVISMLNEDFSQKLSLVEV
jgi:hypothetical protein